MRHLEHRLSYRLQVRAGIPVRAAFWRARGRTLTHENPPASGESAAYRVAIRCGSLTRLSAEEAGRSLSDLSQSLDARSSVHSMRV